ncbi:MAG: lipopolysaccharide heptosyltransferase II [Desulfococcus sp. 4484_242]|nr:MAG: lipopolysaccharide heptosyltransferase II [Desulfococcus sp. 4484_242]
MNLLVIKLSAIGDVVHALPFLEALRKGFPGARIDWVVEEEASQVLLDHPCLNNVLVSRRKSWQQGLARMDNPISIFQEMAGFMRDLRSVHYDLVIDLQGLFKSGVLMGFSKGMRKVGMTGAREWAGLFLNERPVAVDYGQHAVDRYLKMARYLGCRTTGEGGRIPYGRPEEEAVDRLLAGYGIQGQALVAVNPMAKWPTKLWAPQRFAKLASLIRTELGSQVAFTGGPGDGPVIQDIIGMMSAPALNLAGQTTLKELACLYTRCRLLVSTDTGPMHVAAAVGCPVVALFGPTSGHRTGPYGKAHTVVRSDIACRPCFKKRCEHMTCMREISVAQVLEAVKTMLNQTDDRQRER